MSLVEPVDFRIQELAAGFSLGDVTEAELHEIKSYDPKIFQVMVERSEEAAARTFLTFQGTVPVEPMPVELLSRLRKMAGGFFIDTATIPNVVKVSTIAPSTVAQSTVAQSAVSTSTVAPSWMGLREMTAWLSVAASIALLLSVWLPSRTDQIASLQQQRDKLIASASDIVRSKWESTALEQKQGKELGEVIWSSAAQQGFMTIRGLPINDATKEQYQLWIIDPSRDEKPVDGGVFDIASDVESIVPIQAKLRVDKPTVFAITVEKPGGVVVSDQKRMPLLAKIAVN